ncbi:antitoxin Xre-like helix-turn-helix domain-containing protein [Shewanella sp. 6_MG-2023]|uniref:antitoxin Xre-like helix-turn-helix domain-containing protein n=1 Tax=Shewanella sp. 6_MG-2023 TaxID=3062660 RepID=UPI0026E43CD0|nr:antitoxin Xre-like helix-turn-helix domain-containing protein [Shewanella sp. 6_MG-2023]MDO6619701.1 DUF2384 domain-containing protein [Shewanella sp. 6_MG-2023]
MLATNRVQTKTVNKVESRVLAKAVTKLFKYWGISQDAQCSLLGISPSSRKKIKSMEEGLVGIPTGRDSYERVGYLLAIHKALRLLYPQNPELLYGWVTMRNQKFDGRTPLEVMTEDGYLGIAKVSRYLDMNRVH